MTHSPFFSIVIPTYNRASFIGKAIESVRLQRFHDFEIIVVDDGSTDNTEALVRGIPDSRIHYYKNDNGERAAARNFGAKRAVGLYINFLDSDDWLYDTHLSVAHEFIMSRTPDIFHLGYDLKDDNGNLIRKEEGIYSVNRQILSGNLLSCNGVFLKKTVIEQNPFNEDRALSSLEDWELWIRLSARFNFLNSNTITSTVIQHDERSVMAANPDAIRTKVERLVKYVLEDKVNGVAIGRGLGKVVASAYTYAALHILMARGSRREAAIFFMRGLKEYPGELLKKRTLVIIQKLVSI